jgi:hypothetical protein
MLIELKTNRLILRPLDGKMSKDDNFFRKYCDNDLLFRGDYFKVKIIQAL